MNLNELTKKINSGRYFTAIPHEWAPAPPAVLRKLAGDLTREEFDSIPSLQKEHQERVQAHCKRASERDADIKRLQEEFECDLCETFGLNPRHPFAKRMIELARRGHEDYELSEIASEFEELFSLWSLRNAIPEEEDFRTYE